MTVCRCHLHTNRETKKKNVKHKNQQSTKKQKAAKNEDYVGKTDPQTRKRERKKKSEEQWN